MIAHVSINVSDFAKSKEFYSKALAPLGYELLRDLSEWSVAGFGADKKADTWVAAGEGYKQATHIAYLAKDKETVDAFYAAAMAAGGKHNGKPEYQLEYSPGYYAAFVFDLDGNNIEAVFHDPTKE